MQLANYPALKHLVLLGGGHSHAIALKRLAMEPIAGLHITLISDCVQTPYSGMLPGHVAGFYTHDETHIDLQRLAQCAQIDFYLDRAIGLDLAQQEVRCADHLPVRFDALSVDIGSTPQASNVPGTAEYAIAAKPVPQFLHAWEKFLAQVAANPQAHYPIVIVGGGAGGVELALNMFARLRQILPESQFSITLVHRGSRLMSGHNRRVAERLTQALRSRRVQILCNESVTAVQPEQVQCASGLTLQSALTVWVTQASSPTWIKQSGLATCDRGFILVKDTLQSVSHPRVFAAGDIATMQHYPRPKAGVFAVRQGPPLADNLRNWALGQPLQPFKPQRQYLALIGLGDRRAVASWAGLCWTASWLWRWKDQIDRAFMTQFSELPVMAADPQDAIALPPQHPTMYCAGCGAKVGATTLQQVMRKLAIPTHPDAVVGLDTPDDAAVLKIQGEYAVQTIDQLRSVVPDPYLFGQITVQHCLSDLWAMGATPQTVLATVTLPYSTEAVTADWLYQLLAGVLKALEPSQTALVGGHSTLGADLTLGLAGYGTVNRDRLLTKGGLQPGQHLILTKPLGIGTLLAATQQGRGHAQWWQGAIASMVQSNQTAAEIAQTYGATACTDITGFGLAGHLLEMLQASSCDATLWPQSIPVLPGALTTLSQSITSSLHPQNRQAMGAIAGQCETSRLELLFDPQTSGGLLIAIAVEQADDCLRALHKQGYSQAAIVGQVEVGDSKIQLNSSPNV